MACSLKTDFVCVGVERDAGLVEEPGAFEIAGLSPQNIVNAVAVLIDPLTDRDPPKLGSANSGQPRLSV